MLYLETDGAALQFLPVAANKICKVIQKYRFVSHNSICLHSFSKRDGVDQLCVHSCSPDLV